MLDENEAEVASKRHRAGAVTGADMPTANRQPTAGGGLRSGSLDVSIAAPLSWPTVPAIAISISAFFAQVVLADPYYSLPTACCAGVEAAIAIILVSRYMRLRPRRLPWIELLCVWHYLNFGLPEMLAPGPIGLAGLIPRQESFEYAAYLALAAGLIMIAGFTVTRRVTRRLTGDFFLAKLDQRTLEAGSRLYVPITCAYVLVNAAVPAVRAPLLPIAGAIQSFLFLTPLVAVATAVYLSRPTLGNLIQLGFAFVTILAVMSISSMLGDGVLPSIAFLVLWLRARGSLPMVPVCVVIAVVIIVQPVKRYYREIRLGQRSETASIEDVFGSWEEAFSRAASTSQASTMQTQTGSEATIDRLSELAGLAYVIETVPRSVPHADGAVYPLMITAAIPRIFWPDKPNMSEYALDPFVVALGLATPGSSEGSAVGINLVEQGFYEHGLLGSLAWLALYGATAGAFSQFFGTKAAGIVAGASMLGPWSSAAAAGFFNVFGATWQMMAAGTVLGWLLWLLGGGFRVRVVGKHTTAGPYLRERELAPSRDP
jgi:hypothetical protein